MNGLGDEDGRRGGGEELMKGGGEGGGGEEVMRVGGEKVKMRR